MGVPAGAERDCYGSFRVVPGIPAASDRRSDDGGVGLAKVPQVCVTGFFLGLGVTLCKLFFNRPGFSALWGYRSGGDTQESRKHQESFRDSYFNDRCAGRML